MPCEAPRCGAKQGSMFYVYLLKSLAEPSRPYVSTAIDLKRRLGEHNRGESIHMNKFKPWKFITYVTFDDKEKAEAFEKYLKHESGYAFTKKRFW
jgi:putative endonuclease